MKNPLPTLALSIAILSPSAMIAAETNKDGPDLVLSIAQTCEPISKGGRCSLEFVQTLSGQPVAGDVQQQCAPGWLAHITAMRGSVEKGGINRGQAVVCGYPTPQEAIRGLMIACDKETQGICSDANDVNVQWAYWSPELSQIQALARNQSLALSNLPKSTRCMSPVPLQESTSCPPQAAVTLRQSGLR